MVPEAVPIGRPLHARQARLAHPVHGRPQVPVSRRRGHPRQRHPRHAVLRRAHHVRHHWVRWRSRISRRPVRRWGRPAIRARRRRMQVAWRAVGRAYGRPLLRWAASGWPVLRRWPRWRSRLPRMLRRSRARRRGRGRQSLLRTWWQWPDRRWRSTPAAWYTVTHQAKRESTMPLNGKECNTKVTPASHLSGTKPRPCLRACAAEPRAF